MPTQAIYECIAVDTVTKLCTNWQQVTQTLPIAKEDANLLTIEIVAFMAFVFVIKEIKRQVSR